MSKTIGILGAGQLGRMLAMAAVPLGVKIRCLDPSAESPAGQVADLVVGDYTDSDSLKKFSRGLDLVTYEFENIPLDSVLSLQKHVPVFPPPAALELGQDRYHEKSLFEKLGIPVARFRAVNSEEDCYEAIRDLGYPVVMKTRRFGYDGKGQFVLRGESDVQRAWNDLRVDALILEEFVPFDRELSLIGVRNRSGSMAFYPLIENIHKEGILSVSRAPYTEGNLQSQAEGYLRKLFEALDYVGVLTVEFFYSKGQLLANEMAPRVHNSGHWTIEGAVTSQFENHIRAILGFPPGDCSVRGHSGMINLIGTIPELQPLLSIEDAHLHLYGKSPRKNRKLGHITVVSGTTTTREEKISRIQHLIQS